MMNMDYVKKLCEPLGEVKNYKEDSIYFGNIELEIITPGKTLLRIVSDRGDFSCYFIKKKFPFDRWIPLERVIKNHEHVCFHSLKSIVDYLKIHLETIEKR